MTPLRPASRAVLVLTLLATASLGAQEIILSTPDLDQARKLVHVGKVAEAKVLLEKVVGGDPRQPATVAGRTLLDRIRSVEVYLDGSHDVPEVTDHLARYLRGKRLGTTVGHASLPSAAEKLSEHELVVLWQQKTSVKYSDAEYTTLNDYVKAGGRLLLVCDPARWQRANPKVSFKRYPLRALARRFGFRMKKPFEERDLGKGKVFACRNPDKSGLTKGTLTSKDAAVSDEVMTLFDRVLPYVALERSSVNATVPPELTFEHGRITFRYAETLERSALWARKALPTVERYYRDRFGSDLAHNLTFTGVAGTREQYQVGNDVTIRLGAPRDVVFHQLAVACYQAWMRPEGTVLRYPAWMEQSWADKTALDLLRKLGDTGRYRGYERHHRGMFRQHDADMQRIDVANPGKTDIYAWQGKCEFLFDDLVRNFGPTFPMRFRRMVFLYHRSGHLAETLSTTETIRLLSLTAGRDLFPYFRAIGTKVTPVAIDFKEPDRLRKPPPAEDDKKPDPATE